MSIAGSSSIRRLKDIAVVVGLDELAPVGGRPASGRDWRRFERFAEVGEDLPDWPRIGDECDEPDVATTPRARKRKILPHPGHQFRPGNPGCVVRAWLFMSVAAAFHGISTDRMPTGRGIAPLADIPFWRVR